VLLDALLCLFTAALILLLVSWSVSAAQRSSFAVFNAGSAIIEKRNSNTVLLIEGRKHDER
jgi:hypothetical protein